MALGVDIVTQVIKLQELALVVQMLMVLDMNPHHQHHVQQQRGVHLVVGQVMTIAVTNLQEVVQTV